ncbi:pyridoxal phosphate-dependent aminotransferase [Streptomyces sp. TRM76323]|uniref:Pyridoxal phosphate-dependent aminotransferase n=1 Tax=Streptomyces tamarix TaxID=3078565 RepID=A0ABU3QK13_9ACTN|nr:pyridoxal phosphate-dependent aminotransferase [Streptomyces tamarix]MDT9683105.1 pyridoxal phosphate-dependent aminotransferase [Streptomyces tamarix]
MQPLTDVLGPKRDDNPYGDVQLLREYQGSGGDPDSLLYLSLGETWTETAPGLRSALARQVPTYAHGYLLTPYGLPALHTVLRDYVTSTHRLEDVDRERYDTAVVQSGTRQAMFDLGRLLLADHHDGSHPPVLFCSGPGWDYPGVFGGLGFQVAYYPLAAENAYRPDPGGIASALTEAHRSAPRSARLLALNPQHDPTAVDWPPDAMRAIITAAVETGTAILLDDAYYALHDPGTTATSGLRLLLEHTARTPCTAPWLAVRTLGKQFHCNGWAIGAMTSTRETLTALVTRMRDQHSLTCALPLQAAMAVWLEDPAAASFVERLRVRYASGRRRLIDRLVGDLGYPRDSLVPGTCTPFLRVPVPPAYRGRARDYRRAGMLRAHVLLGEGSMTPAESLTHEKDSYVRYYLGHPSEVLDRALDRLGEAGLGWDAEPTPPSGTEGDDHDG